MSRPPTPPGPLAAAALALEEELLRLESLAREAGQLPLTSVKNLRKTGERLRALAGADDRLRERLHALSAAIAELGERQRAFADGVEARAAELETREAAMQDLLGRYEQLGRSAAEVNGSLQHLARGGEPGIPVVDLETASRRMDELIAAATELSSAAVERRFEDIARDAHAMHQQLLATRNKLNLLRERMSRAPLPS